MEEFKGKILFFDVYRCVENKYWGSMMKFEGIFWLEPEQYAMLFELYEFDSGIVWERLS